MRLTYEDLLRMTSWLGLKKPQELRGSGYVVWFQEFLTDGRRYWRPRIRFRPRPWRHCPFLQNSVTPEGIYRGLCSLHPHSKPLVCQLSPLTREVTDDGNEFSELWSVIAPVEGCPGMGVGEPLDVSAPRPLRHLLDREVVWMRHLLSESTKIADSDSAWQLLEGYSP